MPTPEVVNEVVLYKVLLDVDNLDGALMTDMTAQVFFVQGQARDVLVVPVSALEKTGGSDRAERRQQRAEAEARAEPSGGSEARRERRGDRPRRAASEGTPYRVNVMTADGPEERRIMVGLMTRTDAEVLSGLTEGEEVILPVPMASDDVDRDRRGGRRFGGGPRL
jgi:macrolide-specific efflux system membrane fusion protein